MSLHILDTDTLTLLFHNHEVVCQHVVEADELATTIITVDEVLSGWYTQVRRAKRDDQIVTAYAALHRAIESISDMRILAYDLPAVKRFRELRSQNRRIGINDLRIAAITVQYDATLATRNRSDFSGIAGLKIEDWTQ